MICSISGEVPEELVLSKKSGLLFERHIVYGRIIEIKLKNPPCHPGYCFVEFESSRDADNAIKGQDGYNFDGYRLRVEIAHGGRGMHRHLGEVAVMEVVKVASMSLQIVLNIELLFGNYLLRFLGKI